MTAVVEAEVDAWVEAVVVDEEAVAAAEAEVEVVVVVIVVVVGGKYTGKGRTGGSGWAGRGCKGGS